MTTKTRDLNCGLKDTHWLEVSDELAKKAITEGEPEVLLREVLDQKFSRNWRKNGGVVRREE